MLSIDAARLIVTIDKRDALPVRAIPYITGWERYTPDVLAENFAQRKVSIFSRFTDLVAYHLPKGVPVAVQKREWTAVVVRLLGLEAQLKRNNADEAIGYAAWREEAASLLPSGVFVWLDEFEKVFLSDRARILNHDDVHGEDGLIPFPVLEPEARKMILNGFNVEMQVGEISEPDAYGRVPVQAQQEEAILNWLSSNKYDPKNLPIPDKGKSGVKSDCREALREDSKRLFSSRGVFDKTWERLRNNKDIVDSKAQPPGFP